MWKVGSVAGGLLLAGSRAEGLAIGKGWGHPEADIDTMKLRGGLFGVHVPQGRHPPEKSILRYRPEGCPLAYCKIEVTDVPALLHEKAAGELDTKCVYRSEGVDWLHTKHMLRLIQEGKLCGPAGQLRGGLSEIIQTLVCSDAHPDMNKNYVHRPRQSWPSPKLLKVIKELPMLLVFAGHRDSHPDEIPLQARLSWSLAEMVLIIELPENIKQAYIACKYAFKYSMKIFRSKNTTGDGRSLIGSYHLKTVFLLHLERRTPIMIGSQLGLMIGLLHDLDSYLEAEKLPHYFLPDCDLLATVGPLERRIARHVIKHILSDPLRAILTCPTDPMEIYGEVPPEALVTTFHQLSSHPTCVKSREDIFRLLGHLDENRQRRVSGRNGITGLVDMLRKLID